MGMEATSSHPGQMQASSKLSPINVAPSLQHKIDVVKVIYTRTIQTGYDYSDVQRLSFCRLHF